jgi:hypothetical protein
MNKEPTIKKGERKMSQSKISAITFPTPKAKPNPVRAELSQL